MDKSEPAADTTMQMSESTECKYCKPKDAAADSGHSLANCPYCKKVESDVASSCPYCAAMNKEQLADSSCPYCAAMPEVELPTTQDSQDFAGQDLVAPSIPKPDPSQEPPIGLGVSTDTPTVNNEILNANAQQQGVPNEKVPQESVQVDQSKEAMQAIAQEIQGGSVAQGQSQVTTNQEIVNTTDAASAPVSTSMDGNVSRPAGYDQQNVPGDLGVADANQVDAGPDLTEVLQGGLDQHAEQLQREKVVQMVSQALEGFKASKQIIEKAQMQAPQLYQSSIMMLKAMIEMARMLGLGAEGAPMPEGNPLDGAPNASEWQNPFPTHPDQGGDQLVPGHAAPAGENPGGTIAPNEWDQPFPTHPDQGGQPAPGQAPAAGAIGQPIGKLPTSATTKHVARTPLAPGAVNDQGQKKVIDPATDEARFIDMKEGRVLGPNGIPVKPQG